MPTDLAARRAVVLKGMAAALPTHPKDDTSSDLSSSYEAIALLVHGYLTSLKFRLLGFNEDKKIEEECSKLAPHLPPAWNSSFGSHTFLYAHKQSSLTFIIKIDRLGSKVEIRGLGAGDERIHRLETNARDVVRSAALPLRITLTPDGAEDRTDLVEKLRGVFVSEKAVDDLLTSVQTQIVQKLIPKLQVDGYEEVASAQAVADSAHDDRERNPQPNVPFQDPLRQPHNPGLPRPQHPTPVPDFYPPGFEDEHQMLPTPHRQPFGAGYSPFGIGHDDLNPPGLGPHDPLRPHLGGGLPRPGGMGGMHPTFDDPLFQGLGARGQGGQGGFDPQAPPGARWDPVMPGGGPRPRQGGGPGGPFGGDII